jgi:cysteine-rich repeat protein
MIERPFHRAAGFLAVLLALVMVAGTSTGAPGSRPLARLDPRLEQMMKAPMPSEGIAIRVTLKRDDLEAPGSARRARVRARQDRVLGAMAAGRFEMNYRYRSLSGFAGRVRAAEMAALLRHPEVESIHLDHEVRATLAQGRAMIGANAAHAAGLTGAGVNVAVLDSGVDTDHPDLVDDILLEQCFCDDAPGSDVGCCPLGGQEESGVGSAEDDNGHGTKVAGVISSAGVVAGVGVAPDAGIVAIKVLSDTGFGYSSGIDAALDWLVTNHQALGVRIVNASLGDGGEYNDPLASPCSGTPAANAVALLKAAGVVVFAASGNDGHDDGIAEPACIPDVISVGGVYDAYLGTVRWCADAGCASILCSDTSSPDGFVCHSNSDETLDLLAPNWRTTTPELGGGVAAFGGTSAATPYAAGQAALLLQADASLQPEDLRSLLKGHGSLVTNPDNGLSFRRSNVEAALLALSECGNAQIEFGEACDDGNASDGDCCSSSCQFEPAASVCEDGSACTVSDACDGAGSCESGVPPDCDDANACTDDGCDSLSGCTAMPNSAVCDDGDACTTGDLCASGACVGGAQLACDDANVCTDDGCDPLSGCTATPNSAVCDDGDACTTGDLCVEGSCTSGPAQSCDDADLCTDDSCDPGAGCVSVLNLESCDDGDPCTAESCDALTGCEHTPIMGCGVPVPSGSTSSRWFLLAVLLGSACLALRPRRLLSSGSGARSGRRGFPPRSSARRFR